MVNGIHSIFRIGEFTVQLFRASDSVELCKEYIEGHERILREFGIQKIASSEPSWVGDSSVYVIAAFKENREIVGGVRLHKYSGDDTMLPLCSTDIFLDHSFQKAFSKDIDSGVGELCGLWNAKEVSGKGLSNILIRAGTSIANSVEINNVYTLAAHFTLRMVLNLGFEIMDEVGEGGKFVYPTPDYLTSVMRFSLQDPSKLESASDLKELMKNPTQIRMESMGKNRLMIHYDLNLSRDDE